jgi:hypothetical protein
MRKITLVWDMASYIVAKLTALRIQVRSKDSQVKTQLVLWMFILFKVIR